MGDPITEELHVEQLDRESAERKQAEQSAEPADRETHERRADRAAYLREKLGERAASEEEARER
jgi:hypothetical protein